MSHSQKSLEMDEVGQVAEAIDIPDTGEEPLVARWIGRAYLQPMLVRNAAALHQTHSLVIFKFLHHHHHLFCDTTTLRTFLVVLRWPLRRKRLGDIPIGTPDSSDLVVERMPATALRAAWGPRVRTITRSTDYPIHAYPHSLLKGDSGYLPRSCGFITSMTPISENVSASTS